MKGPRPIKTRPRLAWLTAFGLSLIGVAGLCYLLPGLPSGMPLPRPVAPRIVFSASGRLSPAEVAELRAIRSPALIALAPGDVISKATGTKREGVAPPTEMPSGMPLFLGMPIFTRNERAIKGIEGLLYRKELSGAGVSSYVPDRRVFQTDEAAGLATAEPAKTGPIGVTLEGSGGLKGKSIEFSGWSWEPWTRAGHPWVVTVDVQFDEQGQVVEALLDSPAPDNTLGNELIRHLYQKCRIQPAERCQGSITFCFAGKI